MSHAPRDIGNALTKPGPRADPDAPLELYVSMVDDSSQNTEDMLNVLRQAGHGVRPTFADGEEDYRDAL
ncbi:MAG: hypothetical protein HOI95_23500 [Chromatiales bacterium]|nr:hypothetical protein [Chromatiales bacterium]